MTETFSGIVRDISAMGLGVVDHPSGRVFFVSGVWPGDEAEFLVTSTKKSYGFATLSKLTKPSPHRVNSPCKHQGYSDTHCGGCPWMIGDYQSQLEFKQKILVQSLQRGKVSQADLKILPIWGSPQTAGYRNRAQLKTDGKILGYIAAGTNTIVPIDDCLILSDKNREHLRNLKKTLPNPAWSPTRGLPWNSIDIDEDFDLNHATLNKRRPFRQGNTPQNQRMREWLEKKMDSRPRGQSVLELFCGSGNFTEIISSLGFSEIVAVEVNEQAVAQVQSQKFPNVKGLALDIFRPSAWSQIKRESNTPAILVIDPPRAGFAEVGQLVKNFPSLEHIYYISCDVSCFVKEVKSLEQDGWRLDEVQPIDQFPHTPHVEILACLSKPTNK